MNTEHNTSVTLKCSLYISMAVVIAGLVLFLLNMGDTVLRAGLLFVIISPLIGVIVTTVSLYLERDLKWAYVALILIAISVIGILIK